MHGIGKAERIGRVKFRPAVGIIVDVNSRLSGFGDMVRQREILKAQLLGDLRHCTGHVIGRSYLIDAVEKTHRIVKDAHPHALRPQAASQAAVRPATVLSLWLLPTAGSSRRQPTGRFIILSYHAFFRFGTCLLRRGERKRKGATRQAQRARIEAEG